MLQFNHYNVLQFDHYNVLQFDHYNVLQFDRNSGKGSEETDMLFDHNKVLHTATSTWASTRRQ